jgi:malonyl-CoA O-methyltransferase
VGAPPPRALRRAHRRAAPRFAAAEFLHRRLREALLARLDYVRLDPRVVLDLGAGQGGAFPALAARYPQARLLGIDHAPEMLLAAAPGSALRICGDAARLPLPDASIDLVFCNLLLAYCPDPVPVLAEVRRVLRQPGLMLFTMLGPDTLDELRAAWAAADDYAHAVRFPDMHDLGDLLLHAGLAEPVLDRDILQISYAGLGDLRDDLRATGAVNRCAGRNPGLTGKGTAGRLRAALDRARGPDGRFPVTVEVVFGQAWAGEPADNDISIPADSIVRRKDIRKALK